MLKIIQNEKQPWKINLTSEANNGLPFDLTGNVEITVCFKAGTTITKLTRVAVPAGRVVVDDAKLGQISGFLTQAETDAMPVENNGEIEVQVDLDGAGDVKKTQILDAFIVFAKIC